MNNKALTEGSNTGVSTQDENEQLKKELVNLQLQRSLNNDKIKYLKKAVNDKFFEMKREEHLLEQFQNAAFSVIEEFAKEADKFVSETVLSKSVSPNTSTESISNNKTSFSKREKNSTLVELRVKVEFADAELEKLQQKYSRMTTIKEKMLHERDNDLMGLDAEIDKLEKLLQTK